MLLSHGLEETEDDLKKEVSKMRHEKLKINLSSEGEEKIFRIAKNSNKIRPVRLVFASLMKRRVVFKV